MALPLLERNHSDASGSNADIVGVLLRDSVRRRPCDSRFRVKLAASAESEGDEPEASQNRVVSP